MRSTFLINEIHKKHLLNFISNIFCNLARAYSWWGEVRAQSVKLQKLATASLKSWLPSSTLCVTQVLLSDNLGQNKMEQQTPIPSKSRMKPREGQKRAIFPSLIWEGGGSWFSIYFVQDCRSPRRIQSAFNLIVDFLMNIHVMVNWQLSKRVYPDQCHLNDILVI